MKGEDKKEEKVIEKGQNSRREKEKKGERGRQEETLRI